MLACVLDITSSLQIDSKRKTLVVEGTDKNNNRAKAHIPTATLTLEDTKHICLEDGSFTS